MSLTISKQALKNNLLNIYNLNEKYDLISFYRILRNHNDKIRLYTNDVIYQNYITELYNILDVYMYGDGELDIISKNKCCIALRKVIKYIK
jgi:hypothetical protein